VTQLNEVIDQIIVHKPTSINIFNTNINNEYSTTGLNGQFLHFQLLIDVLLRLKSHPTDKNELISLCETEYKDNSFELHILHEFKQTYSPEQAIWWYTRESFLYKILNKALRTQNIDLLFLFRFFIHDLEHQLRLNQHSSSIRVYRSQLISTNELDLLKNSIGQFISMNSFLSTSLDRQKALSFLNQSNHLEQVLFEIDADSSLENIKPFSYTAEKSYFPNEDEILFMLGSIFRINKIDLDQNSRWIIQLTLCSNNEYELKSIFEYMKKQYGDNKTNLLAFGKVLWTMGKLNEAEKYFFRLLNELPKNHEYISYCYRALGNVADDKGDYDTSLKWHLKAIQLMTVTCDANDPILAESYNSIGCVYDTKGEYKQALEYYKKAYTIWKEVYGEEHLKISICLNNIACVYAESEQYSKALQYYQKVLAIRQKHLPTNHSDIGASHNNIGELYRRLGEYELALKHLNISLKIYHLSLPVDHPDQAEVLMNIGLVYQNENNRDQALYYYKEASNIYHKTFNPTHSSIRKIDQLIEHLN
jgi:tetratricopeptide (TPR) repeat protein